jgi:hypothetical protein
MKKFDWELLRVLSNIGILIVALGIIAWVVFF